MTFQRPEPALQEQDMEQFEQSTSLSNGAMTLSVDRGAASEHTISLGERSCSHNFEYLNSIYTEGNETLAEEKLAVTSNLVESGGGTAEQAE